MVLVINNNNNNPQFEETIKLKSKRVKSSFGYNQLPKSQLTPENKAFLRSLGYKIVNDGR